MVWGITRVLHLHAVGGVKLDGPVKEVWGEWEYFADLENLFLT